MDDQQALNYWRALVNFASRVGADDLVNTTSSTITRMSDRDKQWLQEAMADFMKDNDPVRQMKAQIEKIMRSLSAEPAAGGDWSEVIEALQALIDLCYEVDVAADFFKIGGIRILPPLLAASDPDVQAGTAELVGVLCQNHPFCQMILLDCDLLPLLLELFLHCPAVTTKALFAVSSLVRGFEPGEKQFVKHNGFVYLAKLLASNDERLVEKCSFLLSCILQKKEYKDTAIELGIAQQLVDAISRMSGAAREYPLKALLVLITDSHRGVEICQNPDLKLKDTLTSVLSSLKDDDSFTEEFGYCNEIMKICFPDSEEKR